jgi:hypothetical protein
VGAMKIVLNQRDDLEVESVSGLMIHIEVVPQREQI